MQPNTIENVEICSPGPQSVAVTYKPEDLWTQPLPTTLGLHSLSVRTSGMLMIKNDLITINMGIPLGAVMI